MKRKQFLSLTGITTLGITLPIPLFSKNNIAKNKISLAQWSMNRAFFSGKKDAKDFARYAAKMGFAGIDQYCHRTTQKMGRISR